LRHLDEVFTILVILVPKVSEALWERASRRDSVSVAFHDDFKRRPHAHPPPTETEFRLTDPFPKRFANFGNESEKRLQDIRCGYCAAWRPSSGGGRRAVKKCRLTPISSNPKVELCYLDDRHDQVRITGVAEVLTDPVLLREIWESNPLLRRYLGTPENPALIIYRIRPARVRFMREWALEYHEVPFGK
jgi:hypothetical protein